MKWRQLVTANWGLKLVSLGFATLLWMFVVGEKRSEVSLTVPLELTQIPAEMVVVSPVPEAIRVRLNGPRTLLAASDPAQLAVSLDLDGLQPGISTFEILPSRLNLPRGVEVTYISPSVITLEADRKVRKTLPVKVRIRGVPAEGFEVAETRVDPPEVEVEGAERALRRHDAIPTEVVDVTGFEGRVVRPVELAMPDPTLRRVGGGTVKLEVLVREIRAEREFLQVPVALPPGDWQALPPSVDVRLGGSLRALARLAGTDLSVVVEPFGEQAPEVPVRVVVSVPADVEVLGVEPNLVEIEVRGPRGPAEPKGGVGAPGAGG